MSFPCKRISQTTSWEVRQGLSPNVARGLACRKAHVTLFLFTLKTKQNAATQAFWVPWHCFKHLRPDSLNARAPTGQELLCSGRRLCCASLWLSLKQAEAHVQGIIAQLPYANMCPETDLAAGGEPQCGRQGQSEAPALLFYKHFTCGKESMLRLKIHDLIQDWF